MKVTLTINNFYSDGESETTVRKIEAPPPPPEDSVEWDDWWQEHVFPVTGTGHTSGDSLYDCEITACAERPDLVGTVYEF